MNKYIGDIICKNQSFLEGVNLSGFLLNLFFGSSLRCLRILSTFGDLGVLGGPVIATVVEMLGRGIVGFIVISVGFVCWDLEGPATE